MFHTSGPCLDSGVNEHAAYPVLLQTVRVDDESGSGLAPPKGTFPKHFHYAHKERRPWPFRESGQHRRAAPIPRSHTPPVTRLFIHQRTHPPPFVFAKFHGPGFCGILKGKKEKEKEKTDFFLRSPNKEASEISAPLSRILYSSDDGGGGDAFGHASLKLSRGGAFDWHSIRGAYVGQLRRSGKRPFPPRLSSVPSQKTTTVYRLSHRSAAVLRTYVGSAAVLWRRRRRLPSCQTTTAGRVSTDVGEDDPVFRRRKEARGGRHAIPLREQPHPDWTKGLTKGPAHSYLPATFHTALVDGGSCLCARSSTAAW